MKKSTKILLLAIGIIGGATLNQIIPNEFKYVIGFTVGSIIQIISWL